MPDRIDTQKVKITLLIMEIKMVNILKNEIRPGHVRELIKVTD